MQIKLDQFEGPLDLLCHLIDKNEIDIYDIPIALITSQYLEYLYAMQDLNMDMASEFIVMGSTLIEIKSRMLLPEQFEYDLDSEWEDPRTDLVDRILEYRRYKQAAKYLHELEERFEGRFFKEPEDLNILFNKEESSCCELNLETDLLIEALQRVLLKMDRKDVRREKYFHSLKKDPYTVEEKINWIQEKLSRDQGIKFMALFEGDTNRLEVITTFLALLELLKKRTIVVIQISLGDEIEIKAS